MADKKLNEVTKVTDMAYVPVILSDGSVGQIAKADLATVVAGVIFPTQLNEYNVIYSSGIQLSNISLSDAKTTGIYYISSNNVTDAPTDYGILLVVKASWQLFQLFLSNNNKMYVRIYWGTGWSEWSALN